MQKIILTERLSEGEKLLDDIQHVTLEKVDIPVYTKKDILSNYDMFKSVEYIFSSWYMPVFTEQQIIEFFPSLKAVFYAAGTVKYFAEPFLRKNIKVFNASRANGVAVAEFVAAQIVLANKGYFQAQQANKSLLWRLAFKRAKSYVINRPGNYKAKVGLLGCGAVGSEVVRLLGPYDLEIVVYDPYLTKEKCEALNVKQVELTELFETCDVVSNHLPDLQTTEGIINYSLLCRMKDYSTFINTGRGAQIVERDLSKLLRERPTICALLDVVQREVLWPWSSLLRRKNLFVSPHIAGSIGNETQRMVESSLKAYDDIVHGRKNPNEITLSMLDKMA